MDTTLTEVITPLYDRISALERLVAEKGIATEYELLQIRWDEEKKTRELRQYMIDSKMS